MRRAVVVATLLLLSLATLGCDQWSGPSRVVIEDGVALECHGLVMQHHGIRCLRSSGSSIMIPWSSVRGFAAGAAR